MGIKSTSSETKTADETTHKGTTLLRNLESQYETSRVMTHLAKGAGLGYGVSSQITQTEVNPTDTDNLHEWSYLHSIFHKIKNKLAYRNLYLKLKNIVKAGRSYKMISHQKFLNHANIKHHISWYQE